jgi:hypothetical protein
LPVQSFGRNSLLHSFSNKYSQGDDEIVVAEKQEANQSAAANRNLVPCMYYYYFACNVPRHPLSQHHNVNCYAWLMMMNTTNPLPLIIHFKSVQTPCYCSI